MNILEWGRSLVEISAELDPAAPTSLKTFVLLVLPPCWHSGTAPAWQTGRESMFLVQEITIPGDFSPNEQWRQREAFEVCLCFEGPSGFGFVLHGCCLLCSLGCGGCVPSVRPCPGMCPGAGMWLGELGTQKPLCSHAASRLHPGSMSSLLSSALLLCTRRGKVIFCLKRYSFFNLHFYSRRQSDCFVSLEKRGWGSWGKSGKSLRYLCCSHGCARWLSPHQTLPPLHDTIPNSTPWGECHLPPWG